MEGEAQVSDPVDPLQAFSGISLLPLTIRASTDVPLPSDPNDLEAVHHFMKSMVLSSPEGALDEAKILLDKGPELLNTKFGDFLESLGVDKDSFALERKEKLPHPQRREGLGRKRAHFSFKPVTSHPSENLEPNFDIDKLQDPSEFFSAFEKLENARREIQIQKGETSPHLSNYDPSEKRRHRRPGILGNRKSVNYKHRYSSAISEDEDLHMSSQKFLADDALASQGHDKLRPGTNSPDPEREEIDVEELLTETEDKVSEILDELLSKDNEDLNGDGALDLLQERLQMKPIDLGDLSFPDFHNIGRINFKALAENLPRTRASLSNISNLTTNSLRRTPKELKQGIASPLNLIGSPTPPKSPFASVSLMKKRSLQSTTQRDPFSPLNVDLSEQRKSYQLSVNEPNVSGQLRLDSVNGTYETQVSDIGIQRVGHVGLTISPVDKNIHLVKDTDFSQHISQEMMEPCSEMNSLGNTNLFDISSQEEMNSHGKTNASDISGGQEDTERDFSSMLADNLRETHSQEGFPAHEVAKVPEESVNMDLLNESRPPTYEVTQVAAEDNHINTPSNVVEISENQNLQEQHCKTKRPRGGCRLNKKHPLRPSLAAGGTSFESGVRRSKRIKSRPLEYWKGERLLYGRVDESIKLIGLKYISPAKGGGKMKVKSYVADDYKEILELAAAH